MFAVKGTIVSADKFSETTIIPDGYIVVDDNGYICYRGEKLPQRFQNIPVEDYGNKLVLQGFCDMHLHAPQYPMLGTGMDLQLLDWLNQYTFPMESRFADPEFARAVYHQLVGDLAENGTTRVCIFSSIHVDGTLILMNEMEKAGVGGYAGKVNMDRNGGVNYQESTEESIKSTLEWLEKCTDFRNVKPIITPRFTPSCTDRLMYALADIANERNLPIQSHLSENKDEVKWVRQLCPDCSDYWESYYKRGLWNKNTIMAHCVYSTKEEIHALRYYQVLAAHCPDSNMNIRSGIAPVKSYVRDGMRVALGSDISGGAALPLYRTAASAIRASKCLYMKTGDLSDVLNAAEAYYLATSGGQDFFGEKPGFQVGNSFHAVIVDDKQQFDIPTSNSDRLERFLYCGSKKNICAVYANGKKIVNHI